MQTDNVWHCMVWSFVNLTFDTAWFGHSWIYDLRYSMFQSLMNLWSQTQHVLVIHEYMTLDAACFSHSWIWPLTQHVLTIHESMTSDTAYKSHSWSYILWHSIFHSVIDLQPSTQTTNWIFETRLTAEYLGTSPSPHPLWWTQRVQIHLGKTHQTNDILNQVLLASALELKCIRTCHS